MKIEILRNGMTIALTEGDGEAYLVFSTAILEEGIRASIVRERPRESLRL